MGEGASRDVGTEGGGSGGAAPAGDRFDRIRRLVGFVAGPALFIAILCIPFPGLDGRAHNLAAVLALVLTFWVCEPVPLAATALMVPVLLVTLGIAAPAAAFAPFAHPIIFLFMGGFLLAEAMIAHRLNERIALAVLSLRLLRRRPALLPLALGGIAIALSMWVSNSATTAMLLPIALGLLAAIRSGPAAQAGRGGFPTGMLLTLSYASLVGGIGTPVGTPPNLIGIGMLEEIAGVRIGFLEWMVLTIPIMLVIGAVLLGYTAVVFRARGASPGGDTARAMESIRERRSSLGHMKPGEWNTLAAFALAVTLWVVPGVLSSVLGYEAPAVKLLGERLHEGVVAVGAALVLFMLPAGFKPLRFTLEWKHAVRINWGTILLFGGGLSLGGAAFSTGLAEALGRWSVQATGVSGLWGLTALSIGLAIVVTELTSNTATASMLVPLVITLARAAEVSPVAPVVGACLGASMAFMLPVSTPSNAIVYGSGLVPVTAMIRTGVVLDVVAFWIILGGLRVMCPLLGFA